MSKNRAAVRKALGDRPQKIFNLDELYSQVIEYFDCGSIPNISAIRNAANQLATRGEIHRYGYQTAFQYQHKPTEAETNEPDEDPIELLLDALARAEPQLRKIQTLLKSLKDLDQ